MGHRPSRGCMINVSLDISLIISQLSTYSHRYRKIQDPIHCPIIKLIITGLAIITILASPPIATKDSQPR